MNYVPATHQNLNLSLLFSTGIKNLIYENYHSRILWCLWFRRWRRIKPNIIKVHRT
jgi:hypothetical protein